MSRASRFSKGGFHALFRLGPTEGGLDAVVFATRHHLVICTTGVVDGRREIVGVEVQPAPTGFGLDTWMESPRPLTQRAEEVLARFDEQAGGRLEPVSAALLRGIPLTAVLGFREADVADRLKLSEIYERRGLTELSRAHTRDLNPQDEARLPYLDDALMYVAALHQRAKPAELIAEARSISKRTAEGRVAKARALGLLTRASGRTASGELTEDAIRLDAWRTRLSNDSEGKGKSDG